MAKPAQQTSQVAEKQDKAAEREAIPLTRAQAKKVNELEFGVKAAHQQAQLLVNAAQKEFQSFIDYLGDEHELKGDNWKIVNGMLVQEIAADPPAEPNGKEDGKQKQDGGQAGGEGDGEAGQEGQEPQG